MSQSRYVAPGIPYIFQAITTNPGSSAQHTCNNGRPMSCTRSRPIVLEHTVHDPQYSIQGVASVRFGRGGSWLVLSIRVASM